MLVYIRITLLPNFCGNPKFIVFIITHCIAYILSIVIIFNTLLGGKRQNRSGTRTAVEHFQKRSTFRVELGTTVEAYNTCVRDGHNTQHARLPVPPPPSPRTRQRPAAPFPSLVNLSSGRLEDYNIFTGGGGGSPGGNTAPNRKRPILHIIQYEITSCRPLRRKLKASSLPPTAAPTGTRRKREGRWGEG